MAAARHQRAEAADQSTELVGRRGFLSNSHRTDGDLMVGGGGVWLFPFTFLAFCWRWPELALLCDAWRPRQDAAGEKCAVTVPSKSTPLGNNSREDGRFWVRISTRTAVCPGARRIIQLLITVNGL